MRHAVLALGFALIAGRAFAQDHLGVDCARASTAVERAVCGDVELTRADRELAAAFTSLAGRLGGKAKDHLVKDQLRWDFNRRACEIRPALLATCLAHRYRLRMDHLKRFGDGAYPFISEQAILLSDKMGNQVRAVDASYPQFDGTSSDFTGVNREFGNSTREIVAGFAERPEAGASFAQDFELYRPSRNVVSVLLRRSWWGVHSVVSTTAHMVDLTTGRPLGLDDVFVPGADLGLPVTAAVQVDLAEKGYGKPPPDLPDKIGALTIDEYLFESHTLVVSLDSLSQELGLKGYFVKLPYASLRSLLRADGPLGGR
jgi:uncharacterized protein